MDSLIERLDSVFLKDDKDRSYEAYKSFDNYHRTEDVSISDYIIEFEKRFNALKKFNMDLPDGILAFKLLDNAGLSQQQRQLALTATTDIKFSSMKSALQRIFGESVAASSSRDTGSFSIKEENAFMAQDRYKKRFSYNKNTDHENKQTPRGTNPLNKFGRRTKCVICQSVFHWAKDCPHKESIKVVEDEEDEVQTKVHKALFTKDSIGLPDHSDTEQIFMTEAQGSAVIDTACTKTVCGEKWFEHFLTKVDKSTVTVSESKRPFKFGDGKIVYSFKKASIPAKIGNTKCSIETEIVTSDINLTE